MPIRRLEAASQRGSLMDATHTFELDGLKFRAAISHDKRNWSTVTVNLLSVEGDVIPGYHESIGGIESTDEDYLKEMAEELAEEIAGRVGESSAVCMAVR